MPERVQAPSVERLDRVELPPSRLVDEPCGGIQELLARTGRIVPLMAGLVDLDRRVVVRRGRQVTLSPMELRLLEALIDQAGEPVPRAQLLVEVWGYSPNVQTSTVETTMNRLRRKVEPDPSNPAYVVTVRGAGYMFPSKPTPP